MCAAAGAERKTDHMGWHKQPGFFVVRTQRHNNGGGSWHCCSGRHDQPGFFVVRTQRHSGGGGSWHGCSRLISYRVDVRVNKAHWVECTSKGWGIVAACRSVGSVATGVGLYAAARSTGVDECANTCAPNVLSSG